MKSSIRHVALIGALLLLSIYPSDVAAHAELVSAEPKDGSTVEAGPVDIIGTFSEELGPNSHMELRDHSGDVVARAAIDGKTLRIGLEGLQPGVYQVHWTTVTSDDNGVERGSWSFTVTAPTPTKVLPSSAASASPSAAASASATVPPSVAPSPSASPTNPSTSSSNDALLSIVAALVAVALLGALLLRRRPPTAR
jgi:methionine-rich copper-binding protein CopC